MFRERRGSSRARSPKFGGRRGASRGIFFDVWQKKRRLEVRFVNVRREKRRFEGIFVDVRQEKRRLESTFFEVRREKRRIEDMFSNVQREKRRLEGTSGPSLTNDQPLLRTDRLPRGWLLCDFCGGQKTNVTSESNRIYRRCPSCRAIGYLLCSKCKVFKCVTFPDFSDGEL